MAMVNTNTPAPGNIAFLTELSAGISNLPQSLLDSHIGGASECAEALRRSWGGARRG